MSGVRILGADGRPLQRPLPLPLPAAPVPAWWREWMELLRTGRAEVGTGRALASGGRP